MVVKNSYKFIVRGATAPIALKLKTEADISDWNITFTLRTEVSGVGNPLISFNNQDERMVVEGNTVGIVLGPEDTYEIPDGCKVVFIQLLLEKGGVVDATWVYNLGVLPNLLPQTPEPQGGAS